MEPKNAAIISKYTFDMFFLPTSYKNKSNYLNVLDYSKLLAICAISLPTIVINPKSVAPILGALLK